MATVKISDAPIRTYHLTELTDECIDKIADAVVKKLKAEQTEPSDDWICTTCKYHKDSTEERAVECRECGDGGHYERKEQTEPQYDAEEVAKDIDRRVDMVKKEWEVRHTEANVETMSCEECKHYVYQLGCTHHANCAYEPKDEPQTDCGWK